MTQSLSGSMREPKVHPHILSSPPSGYRELSIPAINRRPLDQATKTLVFEAAYDDGPAAIVVTVTEKNHLVNAYVGGALASLVSPRVLMAKTKEQTANRGQTLNDRWRESDVSDKAAVKTLGENLAEMKCAGSAVVKTVLESLGLRW